MFIPGKYALSLHFTDLRRLLVTANDTEPEIDLENSAFDRLRDELQGP